MTSRLAACALLIAGCTAAPPPPAPPAKLAADPPGLHNVFRVSDRLYSGSAPDGDAGFRSLAALGVKTVITVDGAAPDVARARAAGLRYVHLPVGYDGVPRGTALRVARAVRDLPGPVYLHCHHGKHRGPAAAAAALRCLSPSCPAGEAVAFLRDAGTDPRYAGLFADVERLAPPTAGELDAVPGDFPETAEVPALAALMVRVDEVFDRLKATRAPADAVVLAELYREAARLPDHAGRGEKFAALLRDAEDAAAAMERAPSDAALKRNAAACSACHAASRDNRPMTNDQ